MQSKKNKKSIKRQKPLFKWFKTKNGKFKVFFKKGKRHNLDCTQVKPNHPCYCDLLKSTKSLLTKVNKVKTSVKPKK